MLVFIFQNSMVQFYLQMQSAESPTFSNKIRNISAKTEDSMVTKPAITQPVTSSQFHKVMKSLQNMIKQEKQKRQKAEQQIDTYRNRLVDRQVQFKRIIQKYKTKNQNLPYDSEIDHLFSQILNSFDKFNHETEQLIEQKYQQSLNSMTRRIRQIMGHVNQWMVRTATKAKKNPQNIKQQIRVLYEVATQIQDKNIQMMEQVKNLRFENKLLREQRQLIIEQLTRKKNKVISLCQQISALKKNIQQIHEIKQSEKDIRIRNSQRPSTRTSGIVKVKINKFQDIQSTKINSQSKNNKSQIYSSTISNFNPHKISHLASAHRNNHKQTIDSSGLEFRHLGVSHFRKNKSQFHENFNKASQNGCSRTKNQQKNRQIHLKIPKNIQIDTFDNKQKYKYKYKHNTSRINFNDTSIKQGDVYQEQKGIQIQKEKQYHYIHTIQNLKRSLKRQKAKVITLGSVVTQINNQNKEINNAIEQILNESKNSEDRLKSLTECSKLFDTLGVLKKRLSMTQNPSISCGWGDALIDI